MFTAVGSCCRSSRGDDRRVGELAGLKSNDLLYSADRGGSLHHVGLLVHGVYVVRESCGDTGAFPHGHVHGSPGFDPPTYRS